MADFSRKQGKSQSRESTEAAARKSDAPKTGFTEAPKSPEECGNFHQGPGVGNSRRGIH